MREPNGRRDMLVELRLLGIAAALAVSSLVVMACGSSAGEAAGPTSTPTATSTAMGEQASAEWTHTPTPTPTPASSEPERSSTTTPAVTTTTEEVAAEPPLGDCFGGALSEDPLHCYVLEQAQARGLMDILGVYDGDAMLYVSVSQPRVTNELLDFALEQSYAFYDAWPRLVPRSKYSKWVGCTEPYQPWPDCYLDSVGTIGLRYQGGYMLMPQTSAYEAPMLVVTGGDSGRRQTSGWAAWRQLWPKAGTQQGTEARASGGGPAFDVSDVDVINFPEVDCGDEVSAGCDWWKDFPDMGIAGAHGGGIGYFQIKNPPTDEAELKALKHRLMPCHDVIGSCIYTDDSGPTCTVASTIFQMWLGGFGRPE